MKEIWAVVTSSIGLFVCIGILLSIVFFFIDFINYLKGKKYVGGSYKNLWRGYFVVMCIFTMLGVIASASLYFSKSWTHINAPAKGECSCPPLKCSECMVETLPLAISEQNLFSKVSIKTAEGITTVYGEDK